MTSKQLANVLIKILGLSVFVHSVPGIIAELYNAVRIRGVDGPGAYWFYPVSSLVAAAIGLYLMIKTQKVLELLFKDEGGQLR